MLPAPAPSAPAGDAAEPPGKIYLCLAQSFEVCVNGAQLIVLVGLANVAPRQVLGIDVAAMWIDPCAKEADECRFLPRRHQCAQVRPGWSLAGCEGKYATSI